MHGYQLAPASPSSSSSSSSSSTAPSSSSPSASQPSSRRIDKATSTDPEVENPSFEVARRFLQHDQVKSATRDAKLAFLKTKNLSDDQLDHLLGLPASTSGSVLASGPEDVPRPPIVTYPEFLSAPQQPPPLISPRLLLNHLYASLSLLGLVYSAARYVVTPMAKAQTDARHEFNESAFSSLQTLISLLEATVSQPPAATTFSANKQGDSGEAGDPSEMFHRHAATQTSPSLPASPVVALSRDLQAGSAPQLQADRLSSLTQSLSSLGSQILSQSDQLVGIKGLLSGFRRDLDIISQDSQTVVVGGHDLFNKTKLAEPDDEIRKVRDNIRRVKGALLSTRSFPVSTRPSLLPQQQQ